MTLLVSYDFQVLILSSGRYITANRSYYFLSALKSPPTRQYMCGKFDTVILFFVIPDRKIREDLIPDRSLQDPNVDVPVSHLLIAGSHQPLYLNVSRSGELHLHRVARIEKGQLLPSE